MDPVGIWLLILIIFPFIWLIIRVILIAWKAVLVSRRQKNTPAVIIEVIFRPQFGMASKVTWDNYTLPSPPAVVVSPAYGHYYDYNFCFYIAAIFLIFLVLGATKAAVRNRQSLARKAALRDLRARRAQVATVSGSVDANSRMPVGATASSTDQIKTDLPPTYDEVMTPYLNAKKAAAASFEVNASANSESGNPEVATIDIEDSPPHYNNI